MKSKIDIVEIGKGLLHYYIERRRYTVILALLELRPDLIVGEQLQNIFPISDLHDKVDLFRSNEEQGLIQLTGKWGENWAYKLHGIGCELKNLSTGEIFDWDINNPLHFFEAEFEDHLNWRCLNEKDDILIGQYLKWSSEKNNFSELWNVFVENDLIRNITPYEWTVTYK
jgi:hypothetical protein